MLGLLVPSVSRIRSYVSPLGRWECVKVLVCLSFKVVSTLRLLSNLDLLLGHTCLILVFASDTELMGFATNNILSRKDLEVVCLGIKSKII